MLQATSMAERVRWWLNATGRGAVHSRFRRVCNLDWGAWLITLHTAETGHLPGGIEVAGAVDFARLALRPGLAVEYQPGQQTLTLGDLQVSLSRAEAVVAGAPALADPPPLGHLRERRTLLFQLIEGQGRGGLAGHLTGAPGDGPGLADAAARSAWERGATLCESLVQGEQPAIQSGVAGLLGLGEGLTPSGDDLLLGIMAALRLSGAAGSGPLAASARHLSLTVDDLALRATTRISANYLRLGVLGEFSERLTDAALALLCPRGPDECGPAIQRLLTTGHSSGTDSAVGLWLGMSVLMRHQQGRSSS